eukprot:361981-Chlamydomonas_euryale.AAC.5
MHACMQACSLIHARIHECTCVLLPLFPIRQDLQEFERSVEEAEAVAAPISVSVPQRRRVRNTHASLMEGVSPGVCNDA